METVVRYPIPVMFAERFFWQVFLTDTWDHLFVGPKSAGLMILPRKIGYFPSKRTWGRGLSEDLFTVIFEDKTAPDSRVTIGMRANREDERPGILWPGTIKLELFIFSKVDAARLGTDRLATEPIEVWNK